MFALFRKLGPFLFEHKKRYIWATVAMLIANGLILVPPYIIGNVIDAIYSGTLDRDFLVLQCLIFVTTLILSYIVEVYWVYQLFGGRNVLTLQLRRKLMKHFLKMRSAFYEKYRTGDLMARATNDLDAISDMAGYGIMITLDSTLYLGSIIAVMFISVSWKLTLFSLLPLPFLSYILKILGDKVNKRYKESQDAFAEINDEVLEAVEGVRVVRAYVQEDAMTMKFEQQTQGVLEKNISVARINSTFQPIIKIFLGVSYVIAYGYGAVLVSNGEVTLGNLVAFQVYLSMIVWPVQSIGELINMVQQGNASFDRVLEVLNATDDMEEEGKTQLHNEENVGFDQVSFRYPSSGVANLESLQVHIQKGETLGIVGKTGSGKTTFIRQLLREYPLGEGELTVGDVPIQQLESKALLAKIGYVPQDHVLFSRSIRENIAFGKTDATEDELLNAVRLANFEDDLNRMPKAWDTLIGEHGVAVSGGQKQRISIARALLRNPEILILDDSLSAVDAKTEQKIIENIQQLRKGKTTIITTHRLSAIHHADWIIVLDDGKVVEEGTHQELLQADGWYASQYLRQQLKEGGEE